MAGQRKQKKPTDSNAIENAARETGAIVTAEEHYIHGGLASVVAGVTSQAFPVPIEFVGVTQYAESGKPAELLEKYGLTSQDIVSSALKVLERKSK